MPKPTTKNAVAKVKIQVVMPVALTNRIDRAISFGEYSSRTDFIRQACAIKIKESKERY